MEKMPWSATSEMPDGRSFPSTCEGWKTTSGYFAVSKISLCIRASRLSLPLSPLVASTTISPPAFPVSGSICTAPLFTWNVPCTACSELSTLQCTLHCAGSKTKFTSDAGATKFCTGEGVAAADQNTARAASPIAPMQKERIFTFFMPSSFFRRVQKPQTQLRSGEQEFHRSRLTHVRRQHVSEQIRALLHG